MHYTLAAALSFLAGSVWSLPSSKFTTVHPGGIDDLDLSKENILFGKVHSNSTQDVNAAGTVGNPHLTLNFINKFFDGETSYAYIQGRAPNGAPAFVGADGQFIYPHSDGGVPVPIEEDIAIPLGSQGNQVNLTMPDYFTSGRIYFSSEKLHFYVVFDGSQDGIVLPAAQNPNDPNANINWGFVEFTNKAEGLWANLSYVDFVGMISGISVVGADGSVATTTGLYPNAVPDICSDLENQSKTDGRPWPRLCVSGTDGKLLRILSPAQYDGQYRPEFDSYWTNYIDDVWSKYASSPLRIDTQTSAGTVDCQVKDGELVCQNDNRSYPKPTSADIWGCNSGPFKTAQGDNDIHLAVIPRLCAAFVRGTLLLDGGDIQPSLGSDKYYTNEINHRYAGIVHDHEVDHMGYAFPYDDVNPSDPKENAAGLLVSNDPAVLTISVGSPITIL
jgi:hypothetical protein